MTDTARSVIGGRYQIIASLGKGGMGLVYKAYDPVLDRTVALKKMLSTIVDSDELRHRFYIEARAAARLNHPNIVTIYELEEHAGDIYIVMELLEGVSLAAFLRDPVPLSLAGYLTILGQVAEGLHYAHSRAIVHRDIKPANLVLTTNGVVKILDFGIAQLASNEITKKGAMLGTPHYMAPEQVRGEPVDARADLFALGAVAYELVTGVKAFTADNIAALLMRITDMPHTPVLEAAPGTPPALAEIIDRLLSKDRAQRPWNGDELCQALERIGEIDRSDLVAEAVRGVLGPLADETLYVQVGGDPSPVPRTSGSPSPIQTPLPSSPSLPSYLPPPMGPRTPIPAATRGDDSQRIGESVVWAAGTPPPLPPGLAPVVPDLPDRPDVADVSDVPDVARVMDGDVAAAAAPLAAVGEAARAGQFAQGGAPPVPLAAMPGASASAPAPLGGQRPRVDSGVPQARTRRGSGAALIGIAAVLLLAFAGSSWWAYTNLQRFLANRNAAQQSSSTTQDPATSTAATSSQQASQQASNERASTSIPADPNAAPQNAATESAANQSAANQTPANASTESPTTQTPPSQGDPSQTPTSPTAQQSQTSPTIVPNAQDTQAQRPAQSVQSTSPPSTTLAPPNARETTAYLRSTPTPTTPTDPPAKDPGPTAPVRQRLEPESIPNDTKTADVTRPNTVPPDSPRRDTPRDIAKNDRPADPPREVARNDAPAEPSKPPANRTTPPEPANDRPREEPRREPDTRQPLDPGSIAAFQGQGRSASSSAVYSDSPLVAAAVARITYTLEAYSDAIAQGDLDALRDVRSPVTAAEAALLKEADTTVRFSNLDVSVSGTDGIVRCRRAIVSAGKTRASGLVEVRLTRRPSGWVITDIR